ncbi:short chain dehydrogenase [Pestalotiopsis sp. NC0098]|nr:short chain dehydrogenase [Pestalotiopsis sp. NC0098]
MGSTQPSAAALQAAQLFSVDGLVAVVTGGGTGIGLMMAKALAENGAAAVYILGRRMEVLETAAASIGKPSVKPLVCDVTSKDSLQAAADRVKQELGHVNLLICNSGIGGPQTVRPTAKPALTVEEFAAANWDVPMDEYTQTFAVNVTSVWYTTMAFLALLDAGNKKGNVEQKSQVIATSSIAGFNKDAPGGYAYGQSKAAATHLIKALSVALPKWDIRANVICPGLYPSEMSAPIIEKGGEFKGMIPLGRPGSESDMGGTTLYLASRAGAYCNGTVIVSDGGRLGNFPTTF